MTPAPARPRTISIVGNAPATKDLAERIDASDWVVRFNNAAGFGGRSGRRVTHLALVNHGGQMREWLADPGFPERPHLRAAGRILFPFARKRREDNRDGEDGRDWSAEAEAALAPLGLRVEILPEASREAAAADLVRRGGRAGAPPSTGYLVAHHLSRLPEAADARFRVFGFGFAGWEGHAWEAERGWFEDMERANRFLIYPPDAAPTARR